MSETNEHSQQCETSKRMDMFAAAALQGLLASGHYTFRDGDDGEACFAETGSKGRALAVEDAWIIALGMMGERKECLEYLE